LEKARRETQLHLVTLGGGRPETSKHWSFFCVEKSFWAGGLAPHRGHGYALEEYAIRRRRRRIGQTKNEQARQNNSVQSFAYWYCQHAAI